MPACESHPHRTSCRVISAAWNPFPFLPTAASTTPLPPAVRLYTSGQGNGLFVTADESAMCECPWPGSASWCRGGVQPGFPCQCVSACCPLLTALLMLCTEAQPCTPLAIHSGRCSVHQQQHSVVCVARHGHASRKVPTMLQRLAQLRRHGADWVDHGIGERAAGHVDHQSTDGECRRAACSGPCGLSAHRR